MSKIAEKRVKELGYSKDPLNRAEYTANDLFNSCAECYDQAIQDIKEFIYDKFNIHPHDCHVVQYDSDTPLESMDDFVKQIENYIQNEM